MSSLNDQLAGGVARGRGSDATDTRGATAPTPSLWPIRVWLFCVAAMIFAVVIVGGATRLTDSGLSITEWKPLLGAIPPLNAADWQAAFDKYREIPEYQRINKGMSLEAFQYIYWWEWSHRQLARAIGVVFAVPFLIFLVLGRLPRPLIPRLAGLFILGGLQGALGWYMVQSGLSERVDVSQYRLAAHLGLATLVYGLIIWTALGLGGGRQDADRVWQGGRPLWLRVSVIGLVFGIFLQTVLGAFVAGMDAGLSHNTWPLMDGAIIPDGLLVMQPDWINAFENAMTVQFNHRMWAYVLIVWIALHAFFVWRNIGDSRRVRGAAGALAVGILAQAVFGIWTLLAGVPLWLGLVHQGGAFLLFALAIWQAHAVLRAPLKWVHLR